MPGLAGFCVIDSSDVLGRRSVGDDRCWFSGDVRGLHTTIYRITPRGCQALPTVANNVKLVHRHRRHPSGVAGEGRAELLSGFEVPYAQRTVAAAGDGDRGAVIVEEGRSINRAGAFVDALCRGWRVRCRSVAQGS